MKTIAITGIDGSGKSTLMQSLIGQYGHRHDLHFISCPHYHQFPESGVESMSNVLESLNMIGNHYGCPDIKGLALFLQMSLYPKAYAHGQKRAGKHGYIISERYPLIDMLVYGRVYAGKITGNIPRRPWKILLQEEMNAHVPGSFYMLINYLARLNHATGIYADIWNYTGVLKKVFNMPFHMQLEVLSKTLKLPMPDVIYFKDIMPEEALLRIKHRGEDLEIHENLKTLKALSKTYHSVLNLIKQSHPNTEIIFLNQGDTIQLDLAITDYNSFAA